MRPPAHAHAIMLEKELAAALAELKARSAVAKSEQAAMEAKMLAELADMAATHKALAMEAEAAVAAAETRAAKLAAELAATKKAVHKTLTVAEGNESDGPTTEAASEPVSPFSLKSGSPFSTSSPSSRPVPGGL